MLHESEVCLWDLSIKNSSLHGLFGITYVCVVVCMQSERCPCLGTRMRITLGTTLEAIRSSGRNGWMRWIDYLTGTIRKRSARVFTTHDLFSTIHHGIFLYLQSTFFMLIFLNHEHSYQFRPLEQYMTSTTMRRSHFLRRSSP